MTIRASLAAAVSAVALALSGQAWSQDEQETSAAEAPSLATPIFADRMPEDEVIYFLLLDRFANGDPSNDTGGIEGGRLDHGFDPTARGFFQGGDIAGLMQRLDYLQEMGITAIWMAPIFKNKPVQGPPGQESAGYHGYWITDFTRPDPHFGSEEEFAALVEEAHRRGIKVYMDIITNHTADVIQYEECDGREEPIPDISDTGCPYRAISDYPWTTIGGPKGEKINDGFLGDDPEVLTEENFANLNDIRWAYTPYVPEGEEDVKVPAWLNDPKYYANRGNSEWVGESSIYGDFAGLDDIMVENPFVRQGLIDIYADWIRKYKVDGFRVDTVKHVRWDLWRDMAPALMDVAYEEGIPHFHMFAEVYDFDAGYLARFTVEDNFPTTLDFAFQGAVQKFVAEGAPGEVMAQLFIRDGLYKGGRDAAVRLPTFLGNHDMGRFSQFLYEANPDMSDEEAFQRVRLAHAVMFFSRGVPTVYYGDEQGFVSDGNDQLARESMFPSQTDEYNDNDLIGTDATTAEDNFDTSHPLFLAFKELAEIRQSHPALRRGPQVTRFASPDEGILVIARTDPDTGAEYLIAFNAENEEKRLNVTVGPASQRFEALAGRCQIEVQATNSYAMTIPAVDYVICRAVTDEER